MFPQAQQFLDFGYSPIPLRAGGKRPPEGFSWKPFQERKPTLGELRVWFDGLPTKPCTCNLGIVCGAVSGGLFVKDFDTKEGARAFYKAHRTILKTVVETRKGAHFYFRLPGARNTQGKKADTRGEGGYVVAPRSIVEGWTYRFVHPLVRPEELPEYPADHPADKPVHVPKRLKRPDGLEAYLMKIESVKGSGGCNKGLVRFICRCRDEGLSQARCMALLIRWNQSDRVQPRGFWPVEELTRAVESLYARKSRT